MLARDLRAALDPSLLMEAAGQEPDRWQRDVLRSTADRTLINAGRQTGKSATVAALATWTLIYRPGSLVLLLSPSLRQSSELFRKFLALYRLLGRPVPPESETKLTLELETGSRLISLPGKEQTIRGFSSVDLLVCDEAARIEDGLYYSARPMLATSGGKLVAMSTPAGKRGWWHSAWEHGGADWARIRVPASECPRIPAAFLEEERRTLGAYFYAQEYECCFNDAESAAFRREDIDRAFHREIELWSL